MTDKPIELNTNPIIWLDCEMTGLVNDPDLSVLDDEIIEIGVLVTDAKLNPLDEGINLVIQPSEHAYGRMNDFVRKMHTSSGLLKEIEVSGISVGDAEEKVMNYITKHVPRRGVAPIGGNTVGMDRRFLAKYMPRVENHAHYRTIDTSTIKEVMDRNFIYVVPSMPGKNGNHRALQDAIESARELDYYLEVIRHETSLIEKDTLTAYKNLIVNKWAKYLK